MLKSLHTCVILFFYSIIVERSSNVIPQVKQDLKEQAAVIENKEVTRS